MTPRRRRAALALLVAAGALASGLALAFSSSSSPRRTARTATLTTTSTSTRTTPARQRPPFAVGVRFERYRAGAHTILTIVRYPALGPPSAGDRRDAAPAAGPFPLVIFGHGFAVSPAVHASLLEAWARAGYVVAAPVFPLTSASAAGGPNEADLVNQPGYVRALITRLLASSRSRRGPLHGLIDPSAIAVSGQSDGGDTALAVAYDARERDPRVSAAAILSGEPIPQLGAFTFPVHGPPLLATQGSADTINPPSATAAFFAAAHRPKFLLMLVGAPHLPPYTTEQPQLGIVERVTIAFFDRYLKRRRAALARMEAAARIAGVATLAASP